MSIDLNWETLTGGPDGAALAEQIRDFIHTRFQRVHLPRFIKSVTVHDLQFGSIPPQIVLKDICSPLPDFYEENPAADDLDDEESDGSDNEERDERGARGGVGVSGHVGRGHEMRRRSEEKMKDKTKGRIPGSSAGESAGIIGSAPATPGTGTAGLPPHIHTAGLRSAPGTPADLSSPFLGLGMPTPGVPGGTANMHYFPSAFATGWSGSQTPLAAMASGTHLNVTGWLDSGNGFHNQGHGRESKQTEEQGYRGGHARHTSQSSISAMDSPPPEAQNLMPPQSLREKHSVSTLAPTTVSTSRPPTRDAATGLSMGSSGDEHKDDEEKKEEEEEPKKYREPRVEDLQAVFRIRYSGDVNLKLTAEILFDYPMPSFVGIPVKLNITGFSFDGVGVIANIRKRVHFCFLSPEDALAAVGNDDEEEGEESERHGRMGGLLQEIKVESEIGQIEDTSKQSLKNVGKVERFVLEQVRRIFEEEFVYPSFWTFLV